METEANLKFTRLLITYKVQLCGVSLFNCQLYMEKPGIDRVILIHSRVSFVGNAVAWCLEN